MPIKIIKKDEAVLRDTARKVQLLDITSEKIKKIIVDMKEALYHHKEHFRQNTGKYLKMPPLL